MQGNIASLIEALNDTDEHQRYQALNELLDMDAAATLPALYDAVKGMDGSRKNRVQDCLYQLIFNCECNGHKLQPSAEMISSLVEDLRHQDRDIRFCAVRLLGLVGAPAALAVPVLGKVLHETDWLIQEYTVFTLVRIGGPGVSVLANALRTGSDNVRAQIASSLTKFD